MTNLHSVNWELAFLKEDSFPEVPPRDSQSAIWAGMIALRKQFDELFTEAKTSPSSQVVLNRGAYGSGKSHAAIYFGIPERFPSVRGKQVKDVWILNIQIPKDPSQADTIFYRNVIENLQFTRLRQVIRELIKHNGREETLKIIQNLVGSEPLGKAIWLMGLERSPSGQMSLFEDEHKSDEWNRLLEAYFYSQQTRTDLKTLGLSRGIDNPQDRFRVLGAILQCLIGFSPTGKLEEHSRVVLWVDEMEDLLYFTSKQFLPFTHGLRDLIDNLPNYFTLLLNFTLATPEIYRDATVVLGQAIMDRITKEIQFKEPDKSEAYDYVLDILRYNRSDEYAKAGLENTYPFTQKCLKWIIETLQPGRSTPRAINKRCGDIISKALLSGRIAKKGAGVIDIDFVKKLDEERVDLDLT
jgi:hypothetical protein